MSRRKENADEQYKAKEIFLPQKDSTPNAGAREKFYNSLWKLFHVLMSFLFGFTERN